MRRTLFKFIALCSINASFVVNGAAAAPTTQIDELRNPDHMVSLVESSGKSTYDQLLASYRQAILKHPADAALVLSACKFSERFGVSEDLSWADAATKDSDACQATLQKNYSSDTDVELFLLERRFGKTAIEFGEPLVARSKTWPVPQQARLHTALARAYAVQKDDERAGKEAVLVMHLDPTSIQLVPAMRYLAKKNETAAAARLLASAPLPKYPWLETERIRAATELLPGNEAKDELLRARHAGLKIDPYTAARALQHVGDSAGANAILRADKSLRKNETPQNRQFRLDVAFDANDAKAAADIIRDQYTTTHNSAQLASAYARLVGLDLSIVGRSDLIPIAASLITYLLALAAAPGLLMFPVHYRGTVRQRIGKPSAPLFGRIGLRHAWLALSILLPAIYVVTMLRFGGNTSLSPTGGGVARIDWQKRVAQSYLWTLLLGAVGLVWVGRLFSWREWLGSGPWKLSWLLPPAALLAYNLKLCLSQPHTPFNWTNANWTVALVHGGVSLGGIPLALIVLSFLVPIMEELVFRGCLLGGLSRHLSFGWANVLQATVFACLHQGSSHFIYLWAIGATAGWLAKKTKGLSMPIVLHALNNAMFVFSVVA
ncbi:CPBP family intramembrane glutamic endopeptidase [Paraburkholderia rhizosphaerae]|uniref:CAAX prenyl protease 2/Lysostaphin resistance protein A-like domain-containing protein n=1 Tax=Paraburkholderia rhizosphaerae TaxID=480658 RepID=A0A4R8L3J3_9BURK|nr:CPBP family intramembrane glutamic endopeptidase [Paraburkholderia rhizosphaerae]TDY37051.1 hypothetical protein BX592_14610 [Paraburkholderia rhizosphaerae]